jgi:hypothetical protein
MSQICKDCNTVILSTDLNATDNYCSSCMLESAEEIIDCLTEGQDVREAYKLAFEYMSKYAT